MKRKRLLFCMGILSLGILLTGCESKQVKTAKEQFENKNYAEVVSALENEDLKDEEIVKIYNISQAYLCFADGAYDSVVELLSSIETDSPELVNMLAISNANIAFNNKKY